MGQYKIKYVNKDIVFRELPDEVTLYITISNCPCKCDECNSSYLWEDIGEELTTDKLELLVKENEGITAILFGGGDINPKQINNLAKYIKNNFPLKIGWYSGRQKLSEYINISNFDYIKLGPYIKKLGGLDSSSTNQILYKVINNILTKININGEEAK